MLINIDRVNINNRIRKDYGNITELAQSIERLGLMNPPVVDPEFNLIAGERRLKACKELGMNQIEVNVMVIEDYEKALMMEIEENENRKEFTFSERMNYAKLIEEVERLKAKERQLNGVSLTSDEGGRTDIKVAQQCGFGGKDTYRKAKYISENADEEVVRKLDEKESSINKEYQQLKKDADEQTAKIKRLEIKNNSLQQQISIKPKEVIVEKEIDNPDLLTKIKRLEEDKIILERKAKLYEKNSKEYTELKSQIDLLKSQKDDIGRQIESATSISGLIVEIEHMLQTKLAPVKYSRAIAEQVNNPTVINNVLGIIDRVSSWCEEMYDILPSDKKYIDVEVIK